MDANRLALIPDRLLRQRDTTQLREWLHARGWNLSLIDLDTERRRRRDAGTKETSRV